MIKTLPDWVPEQIAHVYSLEDLTIDEKLEVIAQLLWEFDGAEFAESG